MILQASYVPFFASFEDIGEWATLLLCWPVAALLAAIALILAFSARSRTGSKWCAIICVFASAPILAAEISLLLKGTEPRPSIPEWLLKVSFKLAPLFVAVTVLWCVLRALKTAKKENLANAEKRPDATGP